MNPESSTRREVKPLHLVIAAGGTGGHISPAVAVAAELRERLPVEISWIGSRTGFEREAAQERDIAFYAVRTGKLRRYFSLETAVDLVRVPVGVVEARKLLHKLEPDVVFSTGGFVSTPTVIAARSLRVPTLTHEQTASIGLATRINARFCDTVALSFANTGQVRTRRNGRVIVAGNPVRPWVLRGDRDVLRSLYDIPDGMPVIYVTGGAQGAHALNVAVGDALPELLKKAVVIHQCGPQSSNGDYRRLANARQKLDPESRDRYYPVERVGDELAHIYAATSLVVGRAGAGTVAELAALGLPSILVPLPRADEQRKNALVLAEAGGAIVIDQEHFTPDRLVDEIQQIFSDPDLRKSMACGAKSVSSKDPAGRIADELIRLAGR